jgi:hypothetical protein
MPTLRACEFCSELFGISRKCKPLPPIGICCLCGQNPAEVQLLSKEPQRWKAAIAITRSLITHPDDDDAAFRMLVQLCRYDVFAIDRHIRDFMMRIRRNAVAEAVRKRLDRMLSLYEQAFGCRNGVTTDENCCRDGSEATSANEPPAAQTGDGLSAKDLLSPETIVNLDTDEKIERWLDRLRALNVSSDEIDSARGVATGRLRAVDTRVTELYRSGAGDAGVDSDGG